MQNILIKNIVNEQDQVVIKNVEIIGITLIRNKRDINQFHITMIDNKKEELTSINVDIDYKIIIL